MKPLTIEQLKALEVGDWVWIKDQMTDRGMHVQICMNAQGVYLESKNYGVFHNYSHYGKTWLAWKNKEQAEAKGEIVELPCKIETLHVGDSVYYIQEYFNDATLKHERQVKQTIIDYIAKDYIEVNNGVWLSADKFWLIREEAERRLAELTKE